jgi:hypothetical protein
VHPILRPQESYTERLIGERADRAAVLLRAADGAVRRIGDVELVLDDPANTVRFLNFQLVRRERGNREKDQSPKDHA